MHYVISDIHGHMDKFQKMLRLIRFRPWDRLYIIGDAIDRGPDGIEILKYLMCHKNMILLKGNHERDMCNALLQDSPEITDEVLSFFDLWFDNGGEVTYRALLEEEEIDALKIVNFVDELKGYMLVKVRRKDYLLVHAGLLWNPALSFERNFDLNENIETIYEIREGFLDRTLNLPFTVISGHTPVEYLPEYIPDLSKKEEKRCCNHKMIFRKDKILIDCGCGHEHSLGCLRLEDLREFYIR